MMTGNNRDNSITDLKARLEDVREWCSNHECITCPLGVYCCVNGGDSLPGVIGTLILRCNFLLKQNGEPYE